MISGDVTNITNSIIYFGNEIKHINNYRSQLIIKTIEKLKNHFVETSQYKRAVGKLENKNSMMLVGCSGIGKTDTSIMIANYFIEKYGYKFRFVRCPKENDFQNICNLIAQDIDEKEILIFDDFLGNTQICNSENYFDKLEDFIKNIENYDNKKFVFNSRKTLFEAAKVHSKKIGTLIKVNFEIEDLEIWTTPEDKYRIFQVYCFKNEILDKIKNLFVEKIWNDKTVEKIFGHRNFTPFIIGVAASDCRDAEASEFEKIFLKNLNNPEDIWEKEYNALNDASREYINILYSLSDSFIEQSIVDECYENYIKQLNKSPDVSLSEIHNRIKALIHYDNDKIEFIHPSLLDYLKNKISIASVNNIISTAVYFEQIERLNKSYIRKIIMQPDFFKLHVLPITYNLNDKTPISFANSILIQYLKYLFEFEIEDKDYQPIVIAVLKQVLEFGPVLFFYNSSNILNVFKLNYDFSEILSNNEFVKLLFQYANTDNIWNLVELTINEDENGFDFKKMDSFIQHQVEYSLRDIGVELLDCWIEDNMEDYIRDELEEYDTGEEFYYDDVAQAVLERMLGDVDVELGKEKIIEAIREYRIYNINVENMDDLEPSDYIYDTIEEAVIEFNNR
ncbi:hypothetical protein HNQ80_000625 [Anaerosolibacter carboniphilus]|uniref:Novel STAND NTPase 3 domain-containing protein n=1 Tax=Anaerosolibacter carboniphilus TaxID=1417629 RepID=A0A841KUD7_9FIRM|nr:hypothetical protein [Anaerosolibacter carboniphilus]